MRLIAMMIYTALALGANAPAQGGTLDDLATGTMRKLVVAADPAAVPDIAFQDGAGVPRRLSDWSGQAVLVNFWATWCAPCRKEMPSLDALARAMEGQPFAVVTVATGHSPAPAIDRFFTETGVTGLPKLRDPDMALARSMGVLGLPVSVLIDAQGREVARLIGDAEWDSPEARAVVEALIKDARP